jgi:DNA mismatch endonuclease (patch repair protein)
MPDSFSDKERSAIMRAVKSKGNQSTELKLIAILKDRKLTGWRRNYKLFGHPDFVFLKQRVAVFADGCFWHGHNCRNTRPRDNYQYWQDKIEKNKRRDTIVAKFLQSRGWKVVRIWECEIRKNKIGKLIKALECHS